MKLNDIQLRTLRQTAKGYFAAEFSCIEYITVESTRNRLRKLHKALHVHNRLNALRVALLEGILTIDDLKD